MDFTQRRRRSDDHNLVGEDDGQDDPKQQRAASTSWAGAPAENPSQPSSPSAPPVEKERMFDKVVTPSDVGKLNRLVIPKQYAEKYFPLDTTTNEKGLLLNFEDRNGKAWRFRYSYWNSSQSYVMTKGWSRFVKEKRLDAGDTVSFGRGVEDKERLFIDWKRRPEIHEPPRIPLPLPFRSSAAAANYHHQLQQHHHPMMSFARSVSPWAGRLLVPPGAVTVYDAHHRLNQQQQQNFAYNAAGNSSGAGQYLVFRSAVAPPTGGGFTLGGGEQGGITVSGVPMVLESVPVVQSQAAAKRFRLFGVNLDMPDSSEGDRGDGSTRSQASVGFSSSSSPSPKGKEVEHPSLDLEM